MTTDIVIDDTQTLTGTTQGKLIVRTGGVATIQGVHQGSTSVESGGRVVVPGVLQGSLALEDDTEAVVSGEIQGSVALARGGRLVIERSGRFAGSIVNNGEIINRGLRAGSVVGNDPIDDGGKVLQPLRNPDGSHTYMLPPR
jgi:hypothetical protein